MSRRNLPYVAIGDLKSVPVGVERGLSVCQGGDRAQLCIVKASGMPFSYQLSALGYQL